MSLYLTDIFKLTRSRFNPDLRDRIDYMTQVLRDYMPMLADGDGYVLSANLRQGHVSLSYCVFDCGEPVYGAMGFEDIVKFLQQIVYYGTDDELREKYKDQLRRLQRGL